MAHGLGCNLQDRKDANKNRFAVVITVFRWRADDHGCADEGGCLRHRRIHGMARGIRWNLDGGFTCGTSGVICSMKRVWVCAERLAERVTDAVQKNKRPKNGIQRRVRGVEYRFSVDWHMTTVARMEVGDCVVEGSRLLREAMGGTCKVERMQIRTDSRLG